MLPMHRSHGLQGSLKRRYKHPFLTSINGYHTAKNGLGAIVYKWPTFAFTDESEYNTRLRQQDRTQRLTHRNRGLPDGAAITTLGAFRTFTNIPGPGIRTASFAAFGAWSGVLPKNAGSLGTAMRSCASLFRGVAAPLGCVICLQLGDVAVFSLCAQYFLNVRGGGGITTLGAFHTFRKPCVAGV